MNIKVDKKDEGKGEVELTITIPFSEQKNILEKTAKKISGKKPVKGFRPGKAPYEAMEKAFGGATILNEALEELLSVSYYQALQDEKLTAIGSPEISIVKQAYGDDVVYKAIVSLLPSVELGDFSDIKIKRKAVNVPDKEVDKAIEDLRKLRAQDKEVDREAKEDDLVEIDFSTTLNNIPLEGGQASKYQLILGDKQMIPGFEAKIVGMKKGEEKKFKLKFPKDYKKGLAGKEAEFTVKLLAVRERKLPELNDEFAKSLGQASLNDLKKTLKQNIESEAKRKEEQRTEIEMLQEVVKKSKFGPIPKSLIDNEIHRMTHELEDDLQMRGISYSDYLNNLGKRDQEFKEDLKPKAEERVKTALVSRELAMQKDIKASKEEIDKELDLARVQYQNNPEVLKNLERPDYREYIANVLTNRKVIEWLKKKIVE